MTTPAPASTARGNSGNVSLGPGLLYVAPVGTAEPTTATGTLDPAFRKIGYTEAGSSFDYVIASQEITVAEELDAILYATTGRRASVKFNMAEVTRANLALALNQGATATNDGTAFEPPEVGKESRVMIAHRMDNGALWLYRQALQIGSVAINRAKAPAKTFIAVDFALEKPAPKADGTPVAPFKVFPNTNGTI